MQLYIRAQVAITRNCVYTHRRIAHRNINTLFASAPPPSRTLGSEDVNECNDPGAALEPPNMCPHPHARPIRLGLHPFHPWVYSGFEYSAITI